MSSPQSLTATTVRVKDPEERDPGRIRLLGVNAPELAHDDIGAQCWAKQAHTRFAELTPVGATVRLVPDPTQADRDAHGRLLRYVLIDDLDVQHILLAEEMCIRDRSRPVFPSSC